MRNARMKGDNNMNYEAGPLAFAPWLQSDWLWGFAGGLLIGLAGAIYLLVNGRIMGVSGIVGGLVDGSGRATKFERMAFLIGLIGMPFIVTQMRAPLDTHITSNTVLIVLGGLLVGVGTRIGMGCTSGHGVCGISRFSIRSIVSTLFYIGAGVVVVTAMRLAVGG